MREYCAEPKLSYSNKTTVRIEVSFHSIESDVSFKNGVTSDTRNTCLRLHAWRLNSERDVGGGKQ